MSVFLPIDFYRVVQPMGEPNRSADGLREKKRKWPAETGAGLAVPDVDIRARLADTREKTPEEPKPCIGR